ncbi:hypothetical protein Btru_015076, partial [Bulinus truncatus]
MSQTTVITITIIPEEFHLYLLALPAGIPGTTHRLCGTVAERERGVMELGDERGREGVKGNFSFCWRQVEGNYGNSETGNHQKMTSMQGPYSRDKKGININKTWKGYLAAGTVRDTKSSSAGTRTFAEYSAVMASVGLSVLETTNFRFVKKKRHFYLFDPETFKDNATRDSMLI